MTFDYTSTSLMFPGQGAQYKRMGIDLFFKYRELLSIANNILGYSVEELCTNDTGNKLAYTLYTQPCLFVVNHLSYLEYKTNGGQEDFLIGHSLGEYNALCAAGVFDFETGLRIVKRRAELFAELQAGGMLAVIGENQDNLPNFIQNNSSTIDIANYNSDEQTILSGDVEELEKLEPLLIRSGYRAVKLNVSGAFHSRYMIPAKEKFASFIHQFSFNEPSIPVYSNVKCSLYSKNNTANLLTDQITSPVCWKQQVKLLRKEGVKEFKELGPGSVLTRLVSKINSEGSQSHIMAKLANEDEPKLGILGADSFKRRYNLSQAYVAGAMFRGIASVDLVSRMANANLLSFLGTGGLGISDIEQKIDEIRSKVEAGKPFGINLLHSPGAPDKERELAMLCCNKNIRVIEASAFGTATPALVYYRLKGAYKAPNGQVRAVNNIIAKISRPEVAEVFMSPPPENIVFDLVNKGLLTQDEAACASSIFLASDITTEADSGGHTDQRAALTLGPAICILRDKQTQKYNYSEKIHIGIAGGIGTPVAVAAAFTLGADYVVTGSINQCTVQAGISDLVKDMLSEMNIQDTSYAPAGDMFELGAKVQVLKRGVLFPARANRLYELYKQYNSIDEIPEDIRKMIEDKYFKRSLLDVWKEVENYLIQNKPELLNGIKKSPKMKMANIFKSYFFNSVHLALKGNSSNKIDFQIQCGPSLGAFNQWAKGTKLENWRNRHVDEIGIKLMQEAERVLINTFSKQQKMLVNNLEETIEIFS